MEQFEREYREALDGLEFSGAGKERIMKNLMGRRVEKKRMIRPLRAALIAAALCAALVGTAFAAGTVFRSWFVPVEHDRGWYTQKAYSEVKSFTTDDFSEHILWSPEGNGFWYAGTDSWAEMEDYVGWPLAHNTVMDESPKFMRGAGELKACSMGVRYCEHGENRNRFSYTPAGRDMTPCARELEYVTVQCSFLSDGAEVTVFGSMFTSLHFEHNPYPWPFDGAEYPAGSLSEYTLPNGVQAVVHRPSEGDGYHYPSAWFVYEGALYMVNLWEAPQKYAPEGCRDYEAALYRVLDGFTD